MRLSRSRLSRFLNTITAASDALWHMVKEKMHHGEAGLGRKYGIFDSRAANVPILHMVILTPFYPSFRIGLKGVFESSPRFLFYTIKT